MALVSYDAIEFHAKQIGCTIETPRDIFIQRGVNKYVEYKCPHMDKAKKVKIETFMNKKTACSKHCTGEAKHPSTYSSNKLTYEEVKKDVEKLGITLITKKENYENTSTECEFICTCGNHFKRTMGAVRSGHNNDKCDDCKQHAQSAATANGKEKAKKFYTEKRMKIFTEFIEYAKSVGIKVITSLEEYLKNPSDYKIDIECRYCGERCSKQRVTIENCIKKDLIICDICRENNQEKMRSTKLAEIHYNLLISNSQMLTEVSEYHWSTNVEVQCDCGTKYHTTLGTLASGCTLKCKRCSGSMSKGEIKIENFLINNDLTFLSQLKFKDCREQNPLPFDFYVYDNFGNELLIEYDGVQHYKPVEKFRGEEGFEIRKLHDSIKNKYCEDNNIPLLRIGYMDFDRIDEILLEALHSII